MPKSRHALRMRAAVFYTICIGTVVIMMMKKTDLLLPDSLAVHVARNGEGPAYAVLVCVVLQFVRPRVLTSASWWRLSLTVSAAYMVIGIAMYLLHPDVPSNITTYTESFVTASLVVIYVCLPRPLKVAPYLVVGLLLAFGMVMLNDTEVVTLGAEWIVGLILAPLAFDIFDKRILDPAAPDRPLLRWGWMTFLLLEPFVVYGLKQLHLPGALGESIFYIARAHEIFNGYLLVHIFAALVLIPARALGGDDVYTSSRASVER